VQKVSQKKEEPADSTLKNNGSLYLFLKINKRLVKIDHADIIYAEGLGDYLKVYTDAQTYTTYMTMSKLDTLLPPYKFARIHRSTIINLDHIQYVEGNFVRINNNDLPIGLTYKESLIQKLKKAE